MEFGLSLDPLAVPQRHTLYDSESEEETEPQPQSELDSALVVDGRSTNFEEGFLAGKRLLVAVGSSASVFVRSFIRLRGESLCSVRADAAKVQKGKHFSSGNGTEEITQFHEVEGNTEWAVCYHDTELRLEYCNLWTEKIFSLGQPKQVIVFICRPLYEHFDPSPGDKDHTHILKGLQTSSWPHPPLGVSLEPPNSLQGEAAAVLTHCELQGTPCLAHILYASSSLTQTETAMAFLPALQHPVMTHGLSFRSEKEAELMMKKVLPKPRTDLATLYT